LFFVGIHDPHPLILFQCVGFGLDCMHGGVRWFSNET